MATRARAYNPDIDKESINRIMRNALMRLHEQHIFVADILLALAKDDRLRMTRIKFDDWFMTRPNRIIVAPMPIFVGVITVMFRFDAQVLSCQELKELLDARCVPTTYIHRFARLLPVHEQESFFALYGFRLIQQPHHLYGQIELVHQLQTQLEHKKCVVVTGERGIGKTTVATELAQRYVAIHGAKYLAIDCSRVDSIANFLRTIGVYCDIHVDETHDLQRRLELLFSTSEYVIVLDHVDSNLNSIDGLYRIIKKMIARCVVVITTENHYATTALEFYVHALTGLSYSSHDSPAVQLFYNTVIESNGQPVPTTHMRYLCEKAMGNPRAIIRYANELARNISLVASDENVLFKSFTAVERSILFIVHLLAGQSSIMLTTQLIARFHGLSVRHIHLVIEELTRQFFLQMHADKQTLALTHEMDTLIQQFVPVREYNQLLTQFTEMLLDVEHVSALFSIADDSWLANWRFADYKNVLTIISACVTQRLDTIALRLILYWHPQFIIHGLTHQAIVVLEQLADKYSDVQQHKWVLYTLAMFYSERGLYEKSQQCYHVLKQLMKTSTDDFPIELVHQLYALVGMNTVTSMDDMQRLLIPIPTNHTADRTITHYYTARAYAINAQLYFTMTDYQQSMRLFDLAIVHIRLLNDTVATVQIRNDNAVVMLFLGYHSLAQEQFVSVIAQYQQRQLTLRAMQAQLRLALSYLLVQDIAALRTMLAQSIEPLVAVGNMKDIMYFLDLHIGFLIHLGQYADALTLDARITEFRSQRDLPRGKVFDEALGKSRDFLEQYFATSNDTPKPRFFHPSMNTFDVLAACRHVYAYTPA
jgi:tetratricopeptide (TPR) repeat protein